MRLPLISMDDDEPRARRRRAAVDRDVELYVSRQPCPGCGGWSRLQRLSDGEDGEGCRCRAGAEVLRDRCLSLAERAARACPGPALVVGDGVVVDLAQARRRRADAAWGDDA